MNSSSQPFVTSVVQSPSNHHYDHLLPKQVNGKSGGGGLPNSHRTTVNFFRSQNNASGSMIHNTSVSRDSTRGLGGGWNGGVIEEVVVSPQRATANVAEIPGLSYSQVKVSIIVLSLKLSDSLRNESNSLYYLSLSNSQDKVIARKR